MSEHEANLLVSALSELIVIQALTNRPASQYLPELGESRQPIRFISVDLTDPDGPMIAT